MNDSLDVLDRRPWGLRRLGPMVFGLAFAALSTPAWGQGGLTSGGPTGLGPGLAGPRGSTVNTDPSSSASGDPEQFGGLGGGEGRRSGSAGSPARSPGQNTTPGDPDESRLGAPLGASGTVGEPLSPGERGPGVLGGRLGRGAGPASRGMNSATSPPTRTVRNLLARDREAVEPPEQDPISLARRPGLDWPPKGDDGPADGLTLDAAIDLALRQNLDLLAQKFEIPKAEADVLTAGLRDNPVLYADGQLIPYGNFTKTRPGGGGGQPQYDVNVSFPLDLSGKRRGRVAVARLAKKVTEAQFQDAARNLIDDLGNAFVNVLAARETSRLGQTYLDRVRRDAEDADAKLREVRDKKDATRQDRDDAEDATIEIRSRIQQAQLQIRQSGRQLARSTSTLAQILGVPARQAEGIQLNARLRQDFPTPIPVDDLVGRALQCRPDLVAYRLGTHRADADVRLARANRYSDVYLVYQPYTFQSNHSFGAKGTYTYGVGVNAALPLFNRNQGNILRAQTNAAQTRVELAALEQSAEHQVRQAVRDVELGLSDVIELEREVIPAAMASRDAAEEQYRDDPSKVGDYLDEQADLNDVLRQYRDALIDLRQNMLDLNTAVGLRVLP